MTMHTIQWAANRRFGSPERNLLMLVLAMESGSEREMRSRISRLAEATEIPRLAILSILEDLVARGDLVSLDRAAESPDIFTIVFPAKAFAEPPEETVKSGPCPQRLRRRVLAAFHLTCSYCKKAGDEKNGPDGRSWTVDRIVAGGPYEAENVTLACHSCNSGKCDRPAPSGTLSLAEVETVFA